MHDLTKGNPLKLIILFTVPLLIGNIFQQLYSVIDTLIVGRIIGVNALAAVGSTGGLNMLIIGFCTGTTAGLSILTAQRYGAQDFKGVKRSFATSIVISVVISIILTIISVIFARHILVIMKTPASIIVDAQKFITIIFAGIIASMAFNLLSNMIRALGDSRTPLFFLVIGVLINIVFDFIFILGFHMGVEGAGYATVSAQVIAALLCLMYIYRHIPVLVLRRKDFKITRKDINEHLKVGLPMGFQSSIIAIGSIVLQIMLNTLGASAVAAYTAAGKIDQLATQVGNSFGITLATYAAQNYGARQYHRISKGVQQTLAVSIIFSLVMGALIITFGRPLVNLFIGNQQPHVTDLAQIYFRFNSSCYFILAILFGIRYTLQGLGQSFMPTLAGIAELLMRIFAGIILVRTMGFTGASLANPLAWIGSCLVLFSSYFKTMRKLKQRAEKIDPDRSTPEE
ncbi:MATE family efflux transporter [Latilactobacillus fuchuensis]|uniref:Multi antimicrobial extrusion protein (Na(+)/drug antiporter), MATE family of MDR efflux pumps n=2 Tax=Latilactobacillus fuchuensis TaxID=164393 RepID=A0A2N9DT95_9LACO|nr:MATE family efflux transporter [Latilactobacillus fuchuensis]KRL60816.1 MATE efflux family protein [Latilactobacillus fuchuensis DSM 14340 = JCM 11249]MCP8857315.1 MATE family efflux transporter [Latilactobacillus fuchuensis]SPC36686.1 Multi antimicrobial extrusion protein (Na(+)/drug antiporter), MATE family of MDR efflux pumps [Latilactobacillus fuchuensis]